LQWNQKLTATYRGQSYQDSAAMAIIPKAK